MTATTTATAPLGHNNPPSPIEELTTTLESGHAHYRTTAQELRDGVNNLPPTIEDEETAKRVVDFEGQLAETWKLVEEERVRLKKPHDDMAAAVQKFFKPILDQLDASKRAAARLRIDYQQRQAAAEQKRRDEEAAAARRAKEEAERAAQEAARNARTPGQALAAEEAAKEAEQAAQVAARAEKKADAPLADKSRVRGDYGTVRSLRKVWVHVIDDPTKVDLEALRLYLPDEAIDQAIRAFIRAGGRKLAGVTIREDVR